MLSLKDYANTKGVSYESVRKQVNRYKEELEGHINKVGRTQYLDDEAVEFLDSKRAEHPVVVVEMEKDEEIQRLNDENKTLLIKVAELQDKIVSLSEKLLVEKEERIALLEEKKEEPPKKKWFFWK